MTILNGQIVGVLTVIVAGFCLFYAVKANRTAKNATDGEKLTFFKCYSNYRAVLMWLYFVLAAFFVGFGIVVAIQTNFMSGNRQYAGYFAMMLFVIGGMLSIPGFIFYSTQKSLDSEVLQLEQQQAPQGMNPAF